MAIDRCDDIKLLATQMELFHAIFDKSCDAIVVVDTTFCVRYWSQSAEILFQIPADAIVGKDLTERIVPQRYLLAIRHEFKAYQETGKSPRLDRIHETKALQAGGAEIWVDISLIDIRVDEEKWLLGIIRDVESRKVRELELQRSASTDSLSGLPNRSTFQAQLEEHVGTGISLAIVDIDRFKMINDQYGHPAGDDAIRHISKILIDFFDNAICIARLGGDEFGILLKSTHQTQIMSNLQEFLQRLERTAFSLEHLKLTASIGIALSNATSTPRSLLTFADNALYRSKREGRNRVTLVTDTCSDNEL